MFIFAISTSQVILHMQLITGKYMCKFEISTKIYALVSIHRRYNIKFMYCYGRSKLNDTTWNQEYCGQIYIDRSTSWSSIRINSIILSQLIDILDSKLCFTFMYNIQLMRVISENFSTVEVGLTIALAISCINISIGKL